MLILLSVDCMPRPFHLFSNYSCGIIISTNKNFQPKSSPIAKHQGGVGWQKETDTHSGAIF